VKQDLSTKKKKREILVHWEKPRLGDQNKRGVFFRHARAELECGGSGGRRAKKRGAWTEGEKKEPQEKLQCGRMSGCGQNRHHAPAKRSKAETEFCTGKHQFPPGQLERTSLRGEEACSPVRSEAARKKEGRTRAKIRPIQNRGNPVHRWRCARLGGGGRFFKAGAERARSTRRGFRTQKLSSPIRSAMPKRGLGLGRLPNRKNTPGRKKRTREEPAGKDW